MTLDRLSGVVVDVETGGLDPARCALLDVGLVAVREGRDVGRWACRVAPAAGLDVDGDAARVNGYDASSWRGVEEGDVLRGVADFLAWAQEALGRKQLTWIGANVPFDRGFLRAAGRRCGVAVEASFCHRDADVARIAMVPFLGGHVRGVGIDSLRKSLLGRESRSGPHGALADCLDALDCLRALLQRTEWR